MNSEVGKRVEKVDARAKITGQALYCADLKKENLLHGKLFRSPLPHAKIKRLKTAEAEKLNGVKKIITSEDIPESKCFGPIVKDQPLLAVDKVRHIGEPILAVVAETEPIAKKALRHIDVEFEELEGVFSPEEATQDDAPKVHSAGNIVYEKRVSVGNVDIGFKESDIIIENDYEAKMVEQACLEPNIAMGMFAPGGELVIYASTQHPEGDRIETANITGLPESKIRVVQVTTGGGFGKKIYSLVPRLAGLLAYAVKEPVRLSYSREEEFTLEKRHPLKVRYKTGAEEDGTLKAVKMEFLLDTGAYASFGPVVASRIIVHGTGPYNVENFSCQGFGVYTNNPYSGAMRGFGIPQLAIAYEGQLNILAEELGLSPLEIREKNAYRTGDSTITGQELKSVGLIDTLQELKDKLRERKKNEKPSWIENGIGIASMFFGIGATGRPNPSTAYIQLHGDSSATVMICQADIGQGSQTALSQIAAEALGSEIEDITLRFQDSSLPPGGETAASRSTYISGNAIRMAGEKIKDKLLNQAAKILNISKDSLKAEGGKIHCREEDKHIPYREIIEECQDEGIVLSARGEWDPPTDFDYDSFKGTPYASYSYASHAVDLDVNLITGEITVNKIIVAQDSGKIINPTLAEGQIEGAVVQGLGQALFEEVKFEEGEILNPYFGDYLIPTFKDAPDIETLFVKTREETGPFGAKGLAEPGLIPTPAAILNAIYDATGVRLYSLPATKEKIINALPSP